MMKLKSGEYQLEGDKLIVDQAKQQETEALRKKMLQMKAQQEVEDVLEQTRQRKMAKLFEEAKMKFD